MKWKLLIRVYCSGLRKRGWIKVSGKCEVFQFDLQPIPSQAIASPKPQPKTDFLGSEGFLTTGASKIVGPDPKP